MQKFLTGNLLLMILATTILFSQSAEPVRHNLVDLQAVISDLVVEMPYATPHNFTGETLYPANCAFLVEPAAAALASAASEGRIGGAALDVFDPEPPDFDDPIFTCDNVITTPHVAAMTVEAQSAMATGAATEIRRVLLERLPPTSDVLARRKSI